jgi:hypothetical protein
VDPILHHKLYGDLIIRYGDLLNQRLLLFEIPGGRCSPRPGRTRLSRIGFFSKSNRDRSGNIFKKVGGVVPPLLE